MTKLAIVSILAACFSPSLATAYDSAEAIALCEAKSSNELKTIVIYRDRDSAMIDGSGYLQVYKHGSRFGSVQSVQMSVLIDSEMGTTDILIPTHAIELKRLSHGKTVKVTVGKPLASRETVLSCRVL